MAARGSRLIGAALACYPARWRHRHGEDAAELAALLIADGVPVVSIALSYLAGAARARLTPRPGRRLRRTACALLIAACSAGIPAEVIASTIPARAASTTHARIPAHCRTVSGQAAAPRHATTRRAGHDQSC